MNVGRPAVREAISALQISASSRAARATAPYVAAKLPPGMNGETGIAVLEESDSPFEALQARKAMEIGVVYLAVAGASDDDIRRIKRVWARNARWPCRATTAALSSTAGIFTWPSPRRPAAGRSSA